MDTQEQEGQLTLNQMLKALDKDVASGIEKRLKKLSKKKALKAPLEGNKAERVKRVAAYKDVSKEVSKWEPVIENNRRAKHLSFPLYQEHDVLSPGNECLSEIKPITKLEQDVHMVVKSSETALPDNKMLSKAEEKYLKAISAEEAQERHKELQRMRVLLSSYASKMRRQKAIKSKSYRRLLKHERIRSHIKKVESDKDMLMDEIERLQRIRAQERATLKHKNTGKWAKHAKFRAKYDDSARQAMLEQIGIAEKRLQRPATQDSDSEMSDGEEISDVSEESSDEEDAAAKSGNIDNLVAQSKSSTQVNDRLIVSSEMINSRASATKRNVDVDMDPDDDEDDMTGDDDDEDDPQRKLMSEAFAGDDVVKEFKKQKAKLASEEQPKDIDLFLPGWGDWAGPGLKISKKKRKRYIIKAKKVPRRDENLHNVIISEQANDTIKELMVKQLPRGLKNEEQLAKILKQPTSASFIDQISHRESTRPHVESKLGAIIEPMNKRSLRSTTKAKWSL